MTTPRDINQQITLHRHQATLIQIKAPAALNQIHRENTALDGYPTVASGADSTRTGSSDDSIVDRTVLSRLARNNTDTVALGPTAKLDELADLLAACIHAQKLLLTELERHAPRITRNDIAALRCIGTGGPEGATCTQIREPRTHPEHGGMIDDGRCIDCGKAHDRQERERQQAAAEERRRRSEQAAYMRNYRKAHR